MTDEEKIAMALKVDLLFKPIDNEISGAYYSNGKLYAIKSNGVIEAVK